MNGSGEERASGISGRLSSLWNTSTEKDDTCVTWGLVSEWTIKWTYFLAYGAWYRVQRVINNDCVTGYSGYTGYTGHTNCQRATKHAATQVQFPLRVIYADYYRFASQRFAGTGTRQRNTRRLNYLILIKLSHLSCIVHSSCNLL